MPPPRQFSTASLLSRQRGRMAVAAWYRKCLRGHAAAASRRAFRVDHAFRRSSFGIYLNAHSPRRRRSSINTKYVHYFFEPLRTEDVS